MLNALTNVCEYAEVSLDFFFVCVCMIKVSYKRSLQ